MSSLQMWLAIVGGVILVVLVAYNAWTSRQNQPKQAEPPHHGRGARRLNQSPDAT